jgi:hypothetical protein
MNPSCTHLSRAVFVALLVHSAFSSAQYVPVTAEGLKEELVSVDLSDSRKQVGVYSTRIGADTPTRLAVLLPGSPSVVRPVVENGVMTSSRLSGNFLIRARRHLIDESVASLIVDCQSESGDSCAGSYQASRLRQEDVDRLIAEVKRRVPSISEVWLVGTSMGTISSSFMPTYNTTGYAGAIHTATISTAYAKNFYRELLDFDYRKSSVPQFFIHHINDPCGVTTYASTKSIAEKFNLPLITVSGSSGVQGPACAAQTEHGFKGREKEVMSAITAIINTGKAGVLEIN